MQPRNISMPGLQAIAAALGGEVSNGQVRAPGPGHSAEDKSMSIRLDPSAPDGFLVNTFSPADDPIACKDYVRQKLGIPFKPNGGSRKFMSADEIIERTMRVAGGALDKPKAQGRIAEVYPYPDADGTLLYEVIRYDPKDFRQRRPNGKGHVWNLDGVTPVPYRLLDLLKFKDSPICIVEGEKDANTLANLNLTATTNNGGAGNWDSALNQYFVGREVYIIPDAGEAGAKHGRDVAANLHGKASTIKIVTLPQLPLNGKLTKDVTEWLEAGGTLTELGDLMNDAGDYDPGEAPKEEEPEKQQEQKSEALLPIQWLDMSKWDDEPRPQREWAILDRVPLKQVGLFSGEGGTGKSIIEMMKDVAHVTGKDWMGSLPELGPAFYIGAEDDEKEIHIRFYDIAQHYGITFKELIAGGLYVLCKLGQDATLCALTKSGKVETTDLYQQIYEAAGDIKPKNISIDTLSRAFAGNEIDRVQVYAFAMHMQALAMVAGGSVTILSHPSLAGIASGSGISGSTAWHGAFRFRQYLKGVKPSDGEQPESDLRELEFKKNQYGPLGETVVLRYGNGLFLPVAGMSNLDKLAREAKADELLLDLLKRFAGEGRNVSDKPTSPTYAPTAFAKEAEAKKIQVRKGDLEAAMQRLFKAGKIHVENYGRPSRPYSRIAAK
jgi:RecA-family ATPase